jgi:hypothetical protein
MVCGRPLAQTQVITDVLAVIDAAPKRFAVMAFDRKNSSEPSVLLSRVADPKFPRSCTQCINVGFECKTSDKLSRRAFPRGYTESLEERVRSLEAEVRELKDLLDEKDEKLDVLSRIHSHSPQSIQLSPRPSIVASTSGVDSNTANSLDKDDIFKLSQSPALQGAGANAFFCGASSGRAYADAFKLKFQECGRATGDIDTSSFFNSQSRSTGSTRQPSPHWKAPPRMLSDQLVNIFFQEWAPIFPVLHRPAFLHTYENYVASSGMTTDAKVLVQLHLVFDIASQSSKTRDDNELISIERQWKAALELILFEDSLLTLQCLALAQISCLLSADYTGLSRYKGVAISLAYRLGLFQSQKQFALGTLTSETRKKVFWTLYTLDW